MNGNASMFVAFPNACPGTGTGGQSAGSNGQGGSVPFQGNPIGEPSGQADFGYTYPTSALPFVDSSGSITQSTNVTSSGGQKTQVYPSIDLSLDGEKLCENGLTTWQGEFPNKPNIGQHLQFLVFDDGTNNSISLNGAALQQWYGILHTFPQNYAGYPGPPTGSGCSGNCDISITGNGGAAQTGPPFLVGQSVSGTATFSGNGSVEIFYRPCKALKVPCGSGPGTALVQ
jgi:hypothetical protein